MCFFILETLWNQMRSRSSKYHITGLTFLPTQQRGIISLTKWTTHVDSVSYPNTLYLSLKYKGGNTSTVVSQLSDRNFLQMKTTLPYLHMEGAIFLPVVEEGRR